MTTLNSDPDIEYIENFIPDADTLWEKLKTSPDLTNAKMFWEETFGRRCGAYFGLSMEDVDHTGDMFPRALREKLRMGREKYGNSMPEILEKLCQTVGDYTKVKPDIVLVSWYENFDFLPYHADPPTIVGPTTDNMVIPTLSLGHPRWFGFRRHTSNQEAFGFRVKSGDLVIMRGTFQDRYQHALFPAASPDQPRMSLSFIAYATQPWEQRAKVGYNITMLHAVEDAPVEQVYRGTYSECKRILETFAIPKGRLAMIVDPELKPHEFQFGPDVSPEVQKTFTDSLKELKESHEGENPDEEDGD